LKRLDSRPKMAPLFSPGMTPGIAGEGRAKRWMRAISLSHKPIAMCAVREWRRKRLKSLDSRPRMAPPFTLDLRYRRAPVSPMTRLGSYGAMGMAPQAFGIERNGDENGGPRPSSEEARARIPARRRGPRAGADGRPRPGRSAGAPRGGSP